MTDCLTKAEKYLSLRTIRCESHSGEDLNSFPRFITEVRTNDTDNGVSQSDS